MSIVHPHQSRASSRAQRSSLGAFVGGRLAKIVPLTSKMDAKALATRIRLASINGVPATRLTREGNPPAVTRGGSHDLEHCVSKVNQAQLDGLQALLRVLTTILMRALARSKHFHDAIENNNEIPFLVMALEYGVKLPLASLLR